MLSSECKLSLFLSVLRRLPVQQARRDLEVGPDRRPGEGSHGRGHVLEQAQSQRGLEEDRKQEEEDAHLKNINDRMSCIFFRTLCLLQIPYGIYRIFFVKFVHFC